MAVETGEVVETKAVRREIICRGHSEGTRCQLVLSDSPTRPATPAIVIHPRRLVRTTTRRPAFLFPCALRLLAAPR